MGKRLSHSSTSGSSSTSHKSDIINDIGVEAQSGRVGEPQEAFRESYLGANGRSQGMEAVLDRLISLITAKLTRNLALSTLWAARVSNPARRIKSRTGGPSPICLLTSKNGPDLRSRRPSQRPGSAGLCGPVQVVVIRA